MYQREWERFAGRNYSKAMAEFAEYRQWYKEQQKGGVAPLEDEEHVANPKLANNWLVGTDPEFVVLDDRGRIVNVAAVMPHDGVVGYDHNGHVVEIRPQPAKGTYMILKRIQKEIRENESLLKLKEYKWRAGALVKGELTKRDGLADERGMRTLTLGGHVHIDQPPEVESENFKNVLDALDRLTNHLEQLDILPKAECLARRALPDAKKNGYGQWRNYRTAGELHQRMEYRVMASWLFHPATAYVCLTGAKLCATAPMLATEYLRPSATAWNNLRGFFEAFRHRDTNARRLLEKLIDGRNLKFIQHDPTVGFRDEWRELGL